MVNHSLPVPRKTSFCATFRLIPASAQWSPARHHKSRCPPEDPPANLPLIWTALSRDKMTRMLSRCERTLPLYAAGR
ncbi:hypothetical protein HBI56_155140 [Parastagonospora nodorum]|uniref:Uncharacterized protein n=1 Tax=Phaeosphaeria nodorum (strain SN15 / ATCC MYA-4574 / FGSC 10173) TaxID=321614 RepID=A0A7U2FH83_PHANO|nr:hypothetical protein HBH56_117820 [Parastagonospora nodorum]QRD05232.1 hypothetical protein JI435_422170 [Parastagonospora nodorum SN15]KAH3928721.1 hypothetical protein HBH54_131390 [Parastagonospora nodorum]KAH4072409.1 hypothetical protein HBH50_059220 [Parastagonospora nodorum]KAH4088923.1 hypothetical protein HBH48_120700 [Parastagonospora nodorum]